MTGPAGAGPDAATPGAAFDTVILAGGSAARMGGADKPGIAVGRTAMLVLVAQAAAAAGTRRLIVVGPPRAGAVGDAMAELGAVVV
ncbi:MAG: NTP transferase domain-containing protein, partial [Streptosporangiaceae bacterium]